MSDAQSGNDAPAARATPPSKTIATWLALVGGSLGLHRFYLHGAADRLGWLLPLPTLVGAYGFWRMRELGIDDRLGALLVPLLGVTVAVAMLTAIVYGLTPDEKWRARWGSAGLPRDSGWAVIIGVVLALGLGATVTMATLAFTAQSYFEATGPR